MTTAAAQGTAGDAQAQAFVEDGYLVVEGLLTGEEVEEIRVDAGRFARGEYPIMNPPDLPPDVGDEEALRAILAVHFPHWVSPVVQKYVAHPAVADVLSRITAAHLAHWDGSVKCMQTMLFVKPPGLQGQAWHQDERFIPTRDRSLVGAWIALDDATRENGCLWVVPGSHRDGYLWPTRPHTDPEEFDPSDEAHGFDESGAVEVEVPAGSVVFFNGYLLHRSFRNRSADQYRRALVNHYCNAWSLLPWMLPQGKVHWQQIGTSDYRVVTPVAGEDPYAWKGYDETPQSVFLRPNEGSFVEAVRAGSRQVPAAADGA